MNHTDSKNKDSLIFGLFFSILFTVFSLMSEMSDSDRLITEETAFFTSGDHENMEESL